MLTTYLPHSAAALADCLMAREGLLDDTWSYDYGVVWRGVEMLYALTGEEKYFAYIRDALDSLVAEDGQIGGGYRLEAQNLDYLCNGRALLLLWERTREEKYLKAIRLLYQRDRQQLRFEGHGGLYSGGLRGAAAQGRWEDPWLTSVLKHAWRRWCVVWRRKP